MHRLCPTTKTTCHLGLHPVSAVPEPAHASYNSGIPLRRYTSLPCVAPTSDASSVHATNCDQSTACLYLLATRSCKACSKRPYHATTMCRACLHASIVFSPNPLSAGFNRASATALKGSEGVCAGRTPPGAVAEQATGPPRHHAPTPHMHRR